MSREQWQSRCENLWLAAERTDPHNTIAKIIAARSFTGAGRHEKRPYSEIVPQNEKVDYEAVRQSLITSIGGLDNDTDFLQILAMRDWRRFEEDFDVQQLLYEILSWVYQLTDNAKLGRLICTWKKSQCFPRYSSEKINGREVVNWLAVARVIAGMTIVVPKECVMTGAWLPAVNLVGSPASNYRNTLEIPVAKLDFAGVVGEEAAGIFSRTSGTNFTDRLLRLWRSYGNDFSRWPKMVIGEVKLTEKQKLDSVVADAVKQVTEYILLLTMHQYLIGMEEAINWRRNGTCLIDWEDFAKYADMQPALLASIVGHVVVASPYRVTETAYELVPEDIGAAVRLFARRKRS